MLCPEIALLILARSLEIGMGDLVPEKGLIGLARVLRVSRSDYLQLQGSLCFNPSIYQEHIQHAR